MTYLQKQWLKALRSGDYKKIKGRLQSKRGYSCLGVACVVAEKDNYFVARFTKSNYLKGTSLFYQPRVMDAFLFTYPGENRLILMNDTENFTFAKIADAVKANPSYFFGE